MSASTKQKRLKCRRAFCAVGLSVVMLISLAAPRVMAMNVNLAIPFSDRCAGPQTPVLSFRSPQSDNMLFDEGTKIEIVCQSGLRSVGLKWTLHRNLVQKEFCSGAAEALPANRFIIRVDTARLHPGFYDLNVTLDSGMPPAPKGPDGARPVVGRCTFGWKVGEMAIAKSRPADFKAFWDEAKAKLANIPLDAKEGPMQVFGPKEINDYNLKNACLPPDYDPAGHKSETVESSKMDFAGPDGGRVYGLLAKPEGKGPFPAMLVLPGAGFNARPRPLEHARHGYVALDIQVHGQDVDLKEYPKLSGYSENVVLEPVSAYYYYYVHLRCLQAVNYLLSRPDVDPKRLVVVGGSQGGRLSIVVAGLDPRVKAAVPCIAHFSNQPHDRWVRRCNGFANPGDKEPDPSIPLSDGMDVAGAPPLFNDPSDRCLAYYDPMNFAPDAGCPVLFNAGLIDPVSPPYGVFAAFSRWGGKDRTMMALDGLGHDWSAEFDRRAWRWLENVLGDKPFAASASAAPLDKALPRTLGKLRVGEPVTLVGFGDSITTYPGATQLFPELMYYGIFARHLENRFPKAPITVINAGAGGNTTVSALMRLERDVIARKPDLVFVMLGANDSGFISLAEYERNLRMIVSRIKETGSDVVILGTTLDPTDLTAKLGNNAVALRVAAELNVPGVDGFHALSPVAAAGKDGLRVTSLEHFVQYLGGLFPPEDPIHPNYLGHYQLGHLLFRTLDGQRLPRPPAVSLHRRFNPDMSAEYELTPGAKGGALPVGRLLVLGLPQWDVPGTHLQELPLGNGLNARVRVLAEQKVGSVAGEPFRMSWKLPSAAAPGKDWRVLDPDRAVAVLLWLTDAGPTFLDYVLATPPPGQPRFGAITWSETKYASVHLAEPKLPVRIKVADAGQRNLSARLDWNGRQWTAPVQAGGSAELSIEFGELAGTRHDLATVTLFDSENGTAPLDAQSFIVQLSATIKPVKAAAPTQWFDVLAPDHAPAVVARLGAVADDTRLRLVWQVNDAHLVALKDGYHTDGVELYFIRDAKTFQAGAFLPEGLAEGPPRLAPGGGAKAEDLNEWSAAWKRLPDGYEMTVTIPLAQVKDWARAGLLPFSCAINSLDAPDNPRQTRKQWMWLGRNSNYWNPTRYGAIRLDGEPRREWDANVFP